MERTLADSGPAREAAPRIAAAMRRMAQASGADSSAAAAALERLEIWAFDPATAQEAVAADVVDELRGIARGWSKEADRAVALAPAPAVVLAVVMLGSAAAVAAQPIGRQAAGDDAEAVDSARALYRQALEETDRLRRVRLFTRSEQAFRRLAAANPDAPELQVDWGNAALGAQDVGRAVLAYRRALRSAPKHERATVNLSWMRDRLPTWLPRPVATGALESLLFWRGRLTPAQLHLAGAGAFAVGVLLFVFRARRGGRPLRHLVVPALAIWAVATASALLAEGGGEGAVVLLDGATLRAADSAGASPAFANPLPAGTEVTVIEQRPFWVRVALADGTRGWLAASAVEVVTKAAETTVRGTYLDARAAL